MPRVFRTLASRETPRATVTGEERSVLLDAARQAYWMRRRGMMAYGCVINTCGPDAFFRAAMPFIDACEDRGVLPTAEAILANLRTSGS